MHARLSHKVIYVEPLTIFFILTLVVGCAPSTSKNIGQISHRSVSDIKTSTPAVINNGNASVDADGLHIQPTYGIECSLGSHNGFTPPNHLVLATKRTTYNIDELKRISNYLNALSQTNETIKSISNINIPLPASLSWAAGAEENYSCDTLLEITNVGNTTIQIPQVDARLTTTPRQNNYQYRLINACSFLLSTQCQCHGCGGAGGDCSGYYATIHLGMGRRNSIFSSTPTGGLETCGELTLSPSSTVQLELSFDSSSSPRNFIYPLMTEITLNTNSGQRVLALPQLGNSAVFANNSQFSCYSLQSRTFVQVDTTPQDGVNCI